MVEPWKSPNYEGRSPFTSESCLKGRDMCEAAAKWIEAHPREFNTLYRVVKDMQSKGMRGRVRDRVATEAMRLGIQVQEGEYRFANALWAPLARYMAFADPSLIGNPIVFQRSDVDTYGLVPVSYTLEYYTFKATIDKEQVQQ